LAPFGITSFLVFFLGINDFGGWDFLGKGDFFGDFDFFGPFVAILWFLELLLADVSESAKSTMRRRLKICMNRDIVVRGWKQTA